jgi:hypothetical protein
MQQARKFLRFTGIERRLVIEAAVLLVWYRLAVWVLPFPLLRRLLFDDSASMPSVRQPRSEIRESIWAIRVAQYYIPKTDVCLVESLVAKTLLRWEGYAPRLRIGVVNDRERDFEAHAWVECDGRMVMGMFGIGKITPFPDIPPVGQG